MLLSTHLAFGQYASEVYILKGDSLFNEGKYTEAFDVYSTVLETTLTYTPKMLLKMAYVKEGLDQDTEALYYLNLYHYHLADRSVLPRITEIAEKRALKGYEFNDYDYFLTLYNRFYKFIVIGNLVFIAIFFLILMYYKNKGDSIFVQGIVFTLFVCLSYYFLNYVGNTPSAIISKENTLLMKGPSAGATVVAQVEDGHRINIIDKVDIWYKINWNGEEVFLRENNVRLIQ